MSIVLSPELERQIEEIVRAEGFDSADQFFRTFVEKYAEQRTQSLAWLDEHRETIDAMVDDGLRDLREGRSKRYDSAGMRALAEEISEGRLRMAKSAEAQ